MGLKIKKRKIEGTGSKQINAFDPTFKQALIEFEAKEFKWSPLTTCAVQFKSKNGPVIFEERIPLPSTFTGNTDRMFLWYRRAEKKIVAVERKAILNEVLHSYEDTKEAFRPSWDFFKKALVINPAVETGKATIGRIKEGFKLTDIDPLSLATLIGIFWNKDHKSQIPSDNEQLTALMKIVELLLQGEKDFTEGKEYLELSIEFDGTHAGGPVLYVLHGKHKDVFVK